MKKIGLSIIVLLIGFVIVGFSPINDEKITNETKVENVSDFCDGWDDGYQEALDGCLKVAVTPVCPVSPVGKNTYKHGYGMGYGKAEAKHCD